MSSLTAHFQTNQGTFKVKMHADLAPRTVSNFYNLATSGFYNGVVFHRIIPNFMIQGGDPEGSGRGGPGYRFRDEFHPELRHSRPGMLSMANAGPNTNGSQFFITVAPTPHLDNRHAIFGEVSEGYEVIEKISEVDTDRMDRPVNDILIEKITFEGEFSPVDIQKL